MTAFAPAAPGADTPAADASPTSCTIHLVRHGRTVLNRDVRFRGRLEVALDDVGRSEAIAAGHALSGAGITAVYSSPLGRALEVGTAIATGAGLAEVHRQDDLLNLDYGRWEALTSEEAAADDPTAWAAYLADPLAAACPDGEALVDASTRVARALRDIGARHPGETVAAVTHGVMVRLAAFGIVEIEPARWQFRIPTGGSMVVRVTDGEVELVSPLPEGTRDEALAAAGVRAI